MLFAVNSKQTPIMRIFLVSIIILLLCSHLSVSQQLFGLTVKIDFSYECLNPDPLFPEACAGHFIMTSPFTLTFDGIATPIMLACKPVIGLGFGRGQKFSTFLYHLISRYHAHPEMSMRSDVFVPSPDFPENDLDVIDHHDDSIFHFKREIFVNNSSLQNLLNPYSSESDENLCTNATSCPEFCLDCFPPKEAFNQLMSWKMSDGSSCYLPNFMNGNEDLNISNNFPFWISKHKYMYLSNAEHSGNPCYATVSHHYDQTKLMCKPIPHVPPPQSPCSDGCTQIGANCLCPP